MREASGPSPFDRPARSLRALGLAFLTPLMAGLIALAIDLLKLPIQHDYGLDFWVYGAGEFVALFGIPFWLAAKSLRGGDDSVLTLTSIFLSLLMTLLVFLSYAAYVDLMWAMQWRPGHLLKPLTAEIAAVVFLLADVLTILQLHEGLGARRAALLS